MKDIYPIMIEGEACLREMSVEIDKDYPNLDVVIQRMYNTLKSTKTGVGLASPQVGLNIRMFIISYPNGMGDVTFINPEIIQLKGSKKNDTESCLSIPGVGAVVERSQKVKIKYYDGDFVSHTKMFKGFEARIIQHEYDHLDGIEYYDRTSKQELERIMPILEELKQGILPELNYEPYGKL